MNIDIEKVKKVLVWISLADHIGDVNNDLPVLASALGLEEPEWDDGRQRWVWEWEEPDE